MLCYIEIEDEHTVHHIFSKGCLKGVLISGAPNNGFLLNAMKTLFRLSRLLLDLQKYLLSGAIKFISVQSSYSQGNLSHFKITRASVIFPKFHYIPEYNYKISSQEKWSKVFPDARDLIWHNAYMTPFICTKSTKLTEFQFRFLHQSLATNVSLVKMGYKDNIRSQFWHEEAENFTHRFWFCSKIELFWKHLIAFLKDRKLLSNDYLLNSLVVLGLMPDTSKNEAAINLVLLLARFYIWLRRSKGNIPTIENFKPFLKQYNKEIEPFPLQ